MSREQQLVPIGGKVGSQKPVTTNDLEDGRPLTQHAYIPVIELRGKKKRWYHVGNGVENQDTNVARFSMDLKVSPDGGTTINDAVGTARWAVYPDEPGSSTPKATGDEFTLAQLRDLDANTHREKEMLPAQKPGAQQDEYVVLEVEIDASQEGEAVLAGNSSITGALSEVKV